MRSIYYMALISHTPCCNRIVTHTYCSFFNINAIKLFSSLELIRDFICIPLIASKFCLSLFALFSLGVHDYRGNLKAQKDLRKGYVSFENRITSSYCSSQQDYLQLLQPPIGLPSVTATLNRITSSYCSPQQDQLQLLQLSVGLPPVTAAFNWITSSYCSLQLDYLQLLQPLFKLLPHMLSLISM